MDHRQRTVVWLARLVIGVVFVLNVQCALVFIAQPERYAPGFEVGGVAGETMVRGIGVLFLMWNCTYPPVLVRPDRQRTLFAVILAQQAIGVIGETALWLTLPPGHGALAATGLRFIAFDTGGLLLMGVAFLLVRRHSSA